jgi:DUF971 family protein
MLHPTAIKLRMQSKLLAISFDDGSSYDLPFEYLRVYSPSAEVRGHGPGQETLHWAKRVDQGAEPTVSILRLVFDDGHDSGLYAWAYLKGTRRPTRSGGGIWIG